ncbi:MAG: reprolysin-like metallopeptidase [Ignavibacteria bacterium]
MAKTFHYLVVLMVTLGTFITLNAQNTSYWQDISKQNVQTLGERVIIPEEYRTLTLNIPEIRNVLNSAPQEKNVFASNSNTILYLPLPEGGFSKFRIVESPTMDEGLAVKYPEIKTYTAQGIDDPYATAKIDITPLGFHAMILTAGNSIFIDPYAKGDILNYISYYKSKIIPRESFQCDVINKEEDSKHEHGTTRVLLEGQLRTYRTAIATTGEYTTYHGGTVAAGLAAVVTALNRVNGVYEKEVSIRMVLIPNNDLLIYTNASTDPYSNTNGNAMLSQNITTCNNIIGSANYDIGHVFSTGGGGVAYLSSVCGSQKAGGVTGLPSPIGDPFYIDYVAHEMGHQYGANHTFNSTTGSCGGGNRNAVTAYEPGSGSTIMAYAGICSPNDLQNNSDAYFLAKSLDEIIQFSNGGGNSCAVVTNTGNFNPVVTLGPGGQTIPKSTPFTLTGTATDANNDPLTYCWEQYDLGPAGSWNAPTGNAPLFRSFNPVTTGTRTFPKLSSLLNNVQVIGEVLPTYTRNLSFVLVARDNKVGGGGEGFEFISYGVTASAGPFLVLSPNTAVTLNANIPQTVTWDVASTNTAPVNCANVNIKLSTDGGNTFETMLLANTPNDGSETVNLPMVSTSTARIKVEAADNIFFDISNINFSITTVSGISNQGAEPLTFKLSQNFPNPFNPTTMINFVIPQKSAVSLSVYDMSGKLVAELINNETRTEGSYAYEFDGSKLSSGMYVYRLTAGKYSETRKMILVK